MRGNCKLPASVTREITESLETLPLLRDRYISINHDASRRDAGTVAEALGEGEPFLDTDDGHADLAAVAAALQVGPGVPEQFHFEMGLMDQEIEEETAVHEEIDQEMHEETGD